MKHGEEKGHRQQTESFAPKDWTTLDGQPVQVPGCTLTQSVCEKWCEHCQRWITIRGVMGEIRWMAEHCVAHGVDIK